MLTEKDYCDKDTCVALAKLGFPRWELPYDILSQKYCLRLDDAQKWLREEEGIFVYIDVPWKTDGGLGWSYFCCDKPMTEEDKEVCFASGGFYDTYEEALLKGIKEALKFLKEK